MKPTSHDLREYSFKLAFDTDSEVHEYGDNAFLLFALALYLRVEDVKELAAEGLIGGDGLSPRSLRRSIKKPVQVLRQTQRHCATHDLCRIPND